MDVKKVTFEASIASAHVYMKDVTNESELRSSSKT